MKLGKIFHRFLIVTTTMVAVLFLLPGHSKASAVKFSFPSIMLESPCGFENCLLHRVETKEEKKRRKAAERLRKKQEREEKRRAKELEKQQRQQESEEKKRAKEEQKKQTQN